MDLQSPAVPPISPQSQTQQQPVYEMKNKGNKSIFVIISIVVLLTVGTGGAYWFVQQNKQQNSVPPTTTTMPQPTQNITQSIITQPQILPTTQVNETAGWKTVVNKNGFSFMYPDSVDIFGGAAVEEKPDITTILTIREKGVNFEGPRMQIGLWDSINEKSESSSYPASFNEFAKIWYKTNVENPNVPVTIIEDLHETTFQGKPSYEFTFKCKGFEAAPIGSIGPTGVCRIIFVNNNGIFYSIGFYKNTVFDKIFATLKFE